MCMWAIISKDKKEHNHFNYQFENLSAADFDIIFNLLSASPICAREPNSVIMPRDVPAINLMNQLFV